MFNNLKKVTTFLSEEIQEYKVLVLGDVMLDKYYFGEVSRISPEAPVPITRVLEERASLGGAANVAHNLSLLGCRVLLGGIAGDDENGRYLIHLLDERGIDCRGLVFSSRLTTTKLRVFGAHQQVVRLDFEETGQLDNEVEQKLIEWIDAAMASGVHALVISDYAKGVCTIGLCQYVVGECSKRGVPVLVDPKGTDWDKYRGATFITPNLKELGEAVSQSLANDDKAVERCAVLARGRYGLKNIVVTRSEKGLSLVNSKEVMHILTRAQEVYDVSGAGDTVAAVLIAAAAGGLDPVDAAHLANLAAGVAVSKIGTYAVSRAELMNAVQQACSVSGLSSKIAGFSEAVNLVEGWRKKGQKIVFTNGCFDILHAGHVIYLEKAKKLGDRLVVGLNTDDSVQRIKGFARPVNSEMDRARLLAALECVDCIVLFNEDTPSELVCAMRPDILVKGGDYQVEEVVGREYAGKVEIVPFEDGYSTSKIIENIIVMNMR
ncbi:bifunctional D-glycero-beta-D-manno-heptose-7-phosphate kinase/D-glycero-beta-D-manno-heptose 1-phosphate adenylyltransferase HldE [Pelotomaculum isophthalicicum JI]|uniref:Bifunctional protein HldE n=1 Tax=Pelotomaculum isophthalicicum JI TaxID=947010 RepID=A0A9X4H4H9_9FIRM|nr:bifunctional D-glycero-beta-D-manno-heptose-7-phosphate kinase/D-glycero-beta-D-manno-heptose 1-phosphate adenylyltransferase HldE [Pelotomaculum isophthalicicum]MDF9406794.1 bifunctional D-glycero-beta-D-manno-heptose-7-phosphate kinase/D-glycero-beta-D-manno-heptose 1-phosphate adenylyltransferase HldE [Pelotomaculum isophthalicicum JI]